jgi:hypothetical protein
MPQQTLRQSESLFRRRLRSAVSALKTASAGRTCGECAHASLGPGGSGICTLHCNYEGVALHILRRDAFACVSGFRPS